MASRTDSFFIRPKRRGLGIEMAPLIDIVFLLLIFFMLNTTFSNPAIPVVMPDSTSEQGDVHEAEVLVVSCTAENKIFINSDEVTLEDYPTKLVSTMEEMGVDVIHYKGDKKSSHERYVQILEASHAAGVKRVNLVKQVPLDEAGAEEES